MKNIPGAESGEGQALDLEAVGRKDEPAPQGQAGLLRRLLVPAVALALFLAAGLLYSSTAQMPFTFDDLHNIRDNPRMRMDGISLEGLVRAATGSPSSTRPVPKITFAINYALHGWDLWGYHAVNIAVHALAALFLFLLIKATLATPYGRFLKGPPALVAFLAALVWLVHPIQTQAVSYLVQRMAAMAAMFYAASLWAFVRARLAGTKRSRLAWALVCALCGLLALGSKENAATLPIFMLVYEWFFFQNLSRRWLKKALPWMGACLLVFALAGLWYVGWDPAGHIRETYSARDFSLGERLLTQFRVVSLYISLLILPLPSRLNLLHDISISRSLFDPVSTLFALVFLAGLLALTVWSVKKHRLLAFCGLWFFGNLFIESSVIALEMIFEHRLYLPSMMLALALVLGVFSLISDRRIASVAVMVIAALFAWGTWERNKAWTDDMSLWADTAKKSPDYYRVAYSYATMLLDADKPEEALEYALKAVRLKPSDPKAHFAVARALSHSAIGRDAEALEYYRQAVEIQPYYGLFHIGLGQALAKEGRVEEAIRHLHTGLRLEPDNPMHHMNAGRALVDMDRLEEAVEVLNRALVLDRRYLMPHGNLGIAHAKLGNIQKAREHFLAHMQAFPEDAMAYFNLGRMLLNQDKPHEAIGFLSQAKALAPQNQAIAQAFDEARQAFDRRANIDRVMAQLRNAIQKNPQDASLFDRLGNLHRMIGEHEEAVRQHRMALELMPGSPEIHNNLALALMGLEDYQQARLMLEKALELDPKSIPALYNLSGLYSRTGDIDSAQRVFGRLLEAGFDDFTIPDADPGMENLRRTPYYRALKAAKKEDALE